jgi:hypothetical protein
VKAGVQRAAEVWVFAKAVLLSGMRVWIFAKTVLILGKYGVRGAIDVVLRAAHV